MAFQAQRDNAKGGVELKKSGNVASQLVRTESPDTITNPKTAGVGYGEGSAIAANEQQSVRPGKRVVSRLGLNMEQTVGDEVLGGVITGRARGDQTMPNWQTRDVTGLEPRVPDHPNAVRQQADYNSIGRAPLPAKLASDEENPVRKP
jgi:hypothetical protein